MTARLAPSVLVGALIRRAEAEGGFAAVLAKGAPDVGSVLVVARSREEGAALYERLLGPDGTYRWEASGGEADLDALIRRRRAFDPDLWIVELDIPSPKRFVAEMNELD